MTRIYLFLAAIGGLVMAALKFIRIGKDLKQGENDANYVETRKRTDKADIGDGDVDNDTKWLRERGKQRRDL